MNKKTVYPFMAKSTAVLALPHRVRLQPLQDIVTDISSLRDRNKKAGGLQ